MTVTYYLSHALTAEQQRAKYDSQARHERYIRDRDAGKTGYKGIQAQPVYGAQNGYTSQQQTAVINKKSKDLSRISYTGSRARYRVSNKRAAYNNRLANSSQQDLGDIYGQHTRSVGGIRQQIAALKNATSADKKANKKAIKRHLVLITKQIQDQTETVQKILQQRRGESENNIQSVRKITSDKIQKEVRSSLDQLRDKNKSLYSENDKFRRMLQKQHMSQKIRDDIQSKIAANNDKILSSYEEHNSKLARFKTSHVEKMNKDLSDIQTMLRSYITQNENQKQSNHESLKSQINYLRENNQKEITRLQNAVNSRIQNKNSSIKTTMSQTQIRANQTKEKAALDRESISKQSSRQKSHINIQTNVQKQSIRNKSDGNLREIDNRNRRRY